MKKILVVEYDSTILEALEFTLNDEGYEVILAKSVYEAIRVINTSEFDLALLDVMLPDGSGYDVCKLIREKGETPVIFLTACDEEVNIVMGLEIGADDYVTKPFKIRELIARIKVNLRRYSKDVNESNIINIGEFHINISEAVVKKNNEVIFLTASEYKLLLKLIQNRGTVLSRTQILESLWDIDGESVSDNTLSVFMKRLRKKIEDDEKHPKYIITVRGIGYKWSCLK